MNKLIPDKNNSKSLNEYDIACDLQGNTTYEIINTRIKRYFHLIKDKNIKEFNLFDEKDNEILYVAHTEYDFFYQIDSKAKLYLVVNRKLAHCLSFKYSNNNSIILKPNELYKYPVLISYIREQYIKTRIKNLSKKHFIFYFRYPPDPSSGRYYDYDLYIDNTIVFQRTDKYVFSMIPLKKEIEIKILLSYGNFIANFTYMSLPYSNITDDTLFCNDDSENIKSFFIKKPKTNYNYIWYLLSIDKI